MGISHLAATKGFVSEFGDISEDNRNVIRMERFNEGLTLLFLGALVVLTTLMVTPVARAFVYVSSSVMLFAMALLSLFTGFKVNFLPYKLCPLIFTVSGLLILQAAVWR